MNEDHELDIFTAPRRNSRHWKPGTITWGELLSWVDNPSDQKECGNYFLGRLSKTTVTHPDKGECVNYHRQNGAVLSRSAVTLDADHPKTDLPDRLELLLPWAALVHTTYSSSPDAPRYRIIIPTDRVMQPEEYYGVCQVLMDRLGRAQFDPSTAEPTRYMFRPSAQEPGWFRSWIIDGDPLPVDEVLADWDPDLSKLPTPKPHPNKRDPYQLEGAVGAFNRAYEDWDLLIKTYDLPYEPATADRWHLVGARSEAGLGVVAPGIVYSHHVTDPAWGQACSAFDLVRLHRFKDLDADVDTTKTPVNRRPSHAAMLDLAATDPRVVAELVGVDFDGELDDVAQQDWRLRLRMHPRTGRFIDTIENWDLIVDHDPAFAGLYFNEMTLAVEFDGDLPWRSRADGGEVFSSADKAALCHYLEREYRIRPSRGLVEELVIVRAARRRVHPIKEYLDGLVWDGVPRLEECLPGVRPTPYTRMVARKALTAAVARIYEPGIKWDHTPVLFGPEGLGKSWWLEKMARGYTANLGRIGDKDTLITMQRSWILISDEGHSLRKVDADVQKEFLTRTADVFRMPYDREAQLHKRRCVIWSTTNDEIFLRRQEGNRRFLIVRCEDEVDFDRLTDEYIDQVWAEAIHLYRQGERLFLLESERAAAAEEREQFTEEDALRGIIEAYLDTLVPDEWDEMSPDSRKLWLQNRADGLVPVGTRPITEVCSAQVWVEALGRRLGDHKRMDLLEINTVLKRIPGWTALAGRHRVPHYGPQLVFRRDDPEDVI